eukprot:TRINITY_DN1006_c0_g1_i1.p1 TRINITY_DN1006_c0_g1~~TRINITY_DN1006_c0_g1_i1.p1  ORF type:complete len:209 (+),score=66.37 TRINITY_DN1006_c0_g1_i1:42-629(+)
MNSIVAVLLLALVAAVTAAPAAPPPSVSCTDINSIIDAFGTFSGTLGAFEETFFVEDLSGSGTITINDFDSNSCVDMLDFDRLRNPQNTARVPVDNGDGTFTTTFTITYNDGSVITLIIANTDSPISNSQIIAGNGDQPEGESTASFSFDSPTFASPSPADKTNDNSFSFSAAAGFNLPVVASVVVSAVAALAAF